MWPFKSKEQQLHDELTIIIKNGFANKISELVELGAKITPEHLDIAIASGQYVCLQKMAAKANQNHFDAAMVKRWYDAAAAILEKGDSIEIIENQFLAALEDKVGNHVPIIKAAVEFAPNTLATAGYIALAIGSGQSYAAGVMIDAYTANFTGETLTSALKHCEEFLVLRVLETALPTAKHLTIALEKGYQKAANGMIELGIKPTEDHFRIAAENGLTESGVLEALINNKYKIEQKHFDWSLKGKDRSMAFVLIELGGKPRKEHLRSALIADDHELAVKMFDVGAALTEHCRQLCFAIIARSKGTLPELRRIATEQS